MGTLENARPAIVICSRDRERAVAFYRDTLGLVLKQEDSFAAVFVFALGDVQLRVSTVADFVPHEHTILGFRVPDVADAVKALRAKGVTFNFYPQFRQDELGILRLPGGAGLVAWFCDTDGNLLSVTDV